jgi:hypothetical protein
MIFLPYLIFPVTSCNTGEWMCVWAGSVGFESFLFTNTSRRTPETVHPPLQRAFRGPPSNWSLKLTTQLSVKVKNVWSFISIHLNTCMSCLSDTGIALPFHVWRFRPLWMEWVWIIMETTCSNYTEQEEVSVLHQWFGCFHCHHHST